MGRERTRRTLVTWVTKVRMRTKTTMTMLQTIRQIMPMQFMFTMSRVYLSWFDEWHNQAVDDAFVAVALEFDLICDFVALLATSSFTYLSPPFEYITCKHDMP